uniref:Uncharacterized protein n=1 Tax=Cacopsylla melanoneura TaxID=428564 RepID=A0A8D9ECT7_9HEMI
MIIASPALLATPLKRTLRSLLILRTKKGSTTAFSTRPANVCRTSFRTAKHPACHCTSGVRSVRRNSNRSQLCYNMAVSILSPDPIHAVTAARGSVSNRISCSICGFITMRNRTRVFTVGDSSGSELY